MSLIYFIVFTLFLERGEGREKEREKNIDQLPATTQACALTGNRTGDLSLCRTKLNQLSHAGQGDNH